MFFANWIIFISPNIIQANKVRGHKILDSYNFKWQEEPLGEILTKIQQKLKFNQAKILLSDQLSYVLALDLEDSHHLENQIEKKLEQIIPEKVSTLKWDYKIIYKKEDTVRVQIEAIPDSIYQQLQQVNKNFTIELIESIAITLAEAIKDKTYLLLFSDFFDQAIIVHHHSVINSTLIKPEDDLSQKIKQLVDFAQENFSIEVTNFILAGNFVKSPPKVKGIKVSQVTSWQVNPVISLHKKKTRFKKDEQLLSLEIGEKIEKKSTQKKFEKDKRPKKKLNYKLIFLIGIMIALAGSLFFLVNDKQSPDTKSPLPSPIASIQPSPETMIETSPSPEPIDFRTIKLQVQNGSGIAGEAGLVANILKAEGFGQIDTANADNYDYRQIEIYLKDGNQELFDSINRALNSDYLISSEIMPLPESSEYDVLIIVGK